MRKTFKEFMDLSKRQGKVLICGDEGSGKTLLTTYISVEKMLNGVKDCWKSFEKIDEYNKLGYKFSKNFEHLVFSNFDINCSGTHIPSFKSYVIDPFKLGLYCEDYETTLLPPYAFVPLTEAQRIFNAYMWQYIRPEIRGYWETSRQYGIELICDTNQPNLIYSGVRSLFNRIIYLYSPVEEIKDKNGFVVGHKLYIKEFKKYTFFEKYLQTSKEDFVSETFELDLRRCVYSNFDSYQCEMLHLKGREEEDFVIEHFPDIKTIDDIESFANNFGLYAKEGYYIKPGDLKRVQKQELENNSSEFDF